MHIWISIAAPSLLAITVSGCATVSRSSQQTLEFVSDPPGAEVRASTGWRCETPCSVEIKRRSSFVVEISKDGYEPVRVNLAGAIDTPGSVGMAGNVLIGGLIGAAIDGVSGAMYSHGDGRVEVKLQALPDQEALIDGKLTPYAETSHP